MLMGNSHLLYEYKTKRVVVLNLDNNKNVMRENTFRFLSSHMGLCLVKGLGKKPILSASKHHCSKFLATNKHTNHDIFM